MTIRVSWRPQSGDGCLGRTLQALSPTRDSDNARASLHGSGAQGSGYTEMKSGPGSPAQEIRAIHMKHGCGYLGG